MVKNIEAPILPQKIDNKKLLTLDLLRGITAFAVFMGHLRTLFFVDYSAIKADKIAQVFFFLTGFGHQSVIIFFILSGFFIAKTIQESIDRHKWRFKDYFINRFIRLETVLIPALILGFIYDTIGLHFFAKTESYAGLIPSLTLISPVGRLDLGTFFANILFLQNITADTFGSNAPLWSLANEFWYYMIFPLIYFSLIKKYPPIKRLLSAILAISILVFIGKTVALYFLIWLMGAGAFYAHRKYGNALTLRQYSLKIALIATFIILLLVLSCTRVNYLTAVFNDFSLGFSTCLFVFLLSLSEIKNAFLKRLATYLSDISYTLYVTHIPIAMLLCSLIATHRHDWNYSNLIIFFLLALIIIWYSTLSWYLFERNTPIIKKWFKVVIG
jgi:peptidoglycan/LPS O-acetylase OafA/YrhL